MYIQEIIDGLFDAANIIDSIKQDTFTLNQDERCYLIQAQSLIDKVSERLEKRSFVKTIKPERVLSE